MAVINGTNFAVSVCGTVVGQATECSISLSQETIDVTTKDSSQQRELIGGLKSGSISISGLVDVGAGDGKITLHDQYVTGGIVTCIFDDGASGGKTYSSDGIITSLEFSGGTEDAATYSASIELSGALTIAAT